MLIENELKNAYIGKKPYYDYIPTSSTIAYYPFKEDINDHSGNNLNLSGTATFSDDKATIASSLTRSSAILGSRGAFTISAWGSGWDGNNNRAVYDGDKWGPYWFLTPNGVPNTDQYTANAIINNSWKRAGVTAPFTDDFLLLTMTYDGSTFNFYYNGLQNGTSTSTSGSTKSGATGFVVEGGTRGQVIIESRGWSASEVLDYYNNSKWNYGL